MARSKRRGVKGLGHGVGLCPIFIQIGHCRRMDVDEPPPKLPLRVRFYDDEHPASLVARLAARAGEPDVGRFARDHGIDRAALIDGNANATLARLADVPKVALDRASGVAHDTQRCVLRGETLRKPNDLRMLDSQATERWYCPCCLADDRRRAEHERNIQTHGPYWRFWWTLTSIRVCPTHRRPLLAHCPSCGNGLGAMTWPIDRCQMCRYDLGAALPPVDPFPVSAELYILGRLGLAPIRRIPFLDGFQIGEVNETILRLGFELHGRSEAGVSLSSSDTARLVQAAEAGLTFCLRGADGVRDLLQALLQERAGGSRSGPSTIYRDLIVWLDSGRFASGTVPAHVATLRRIVLGHALREVPVQVDDRLFGRSLARSRYVSPKSAGALTRGETFLVARAKSAGLMSDADEALSRIRRSAFEEIRRTVRDETRSTASILRIADAGKRLDLPQTALSALTMAGHLPPSPTSDAYSFDMYDVHVLDDFAARCFRRLLSLTSEALPTDLVQLRNRRVALLPTLYGLLDGSISGWGPRCTGQIGSILISKSELIRSGIGYDRPPVSVDCEARTVDGASESEIPFAMDGGYVTISEVANKVGVKSSVILLAVSKGQIATVPVVMRKGRGLRVVDMVAKAELTAFMERWTFIDDVGRRKSKVGRNDVPTHSDQLPN